MLIAVRRTRADSMRMVDRLLYWLIGPPKNPDTPDPATLTRATHVLNDLIQQHRNVVGAFEKAHRAEWGDHDGN